MTIISDCVPSDKISQNPDNAELGYSQSMFFNMSQIRHLEFKI